MIDHLLGRPSPSWKRAQVFLVMFFWIWRIAYGEPGGPRLLWLRRFNRFLQRGKFTPWQIVVSTLTGVYAVRNLDKIVGLGAPEPLANLYSPGYYRATWIVTGLDAGFATALSIRPRWLRDLCSVLFSLYYIVYSTEADEKLRRFRGVPTVEMLRTTWEKATNPYIRLVTLPSRPRCSIARRILLPRPADAPNQRPMSAWLFFAPPEHQLARATDLILDFPGGGFMAMNPLHHEDRLRMWAVRTGKPVLALDYGKAPEYPYPFAIDEAFDAYRVLVESSGQLIGMSGKRLNVILTGDSAGATIVVNVIFKMLERERAQPAPPPLARPVAVVLNYAFLDFNFMAWMSPANLRVLRSEQSSGHLRGLVDGKDHFSHVSPLSMVGAAPRRKTMHRRRSWRDTGRAARARDSPPAEADVDGGDMADAESGPSRKPSGEHLPVEEQPIETRVKVSPLSQSTLEKQQLELSTVRGAQSEGEPVSVLGTRMTMTSRTGYFQDRIITPSMMRAMALLYIGPHRNPEFASDYHISPVLAPAELLAQFPPLLMQCGEKDPFVDDTVIFAGRVREAKRARKQELDLLLAGKSARFGEALRMSAGDGGAGGAGDERTRALRRERDQLAAEGDDAWVKMVIYEDWSHGYLQMASLMAEAKPVINDIADWMDAAFSAHAESSSGSGSGTGTSSANGSAARHARSPPRHARSPPRRAAASAASETEVTETEADSPIVFVARRGTPRTSFAERRRARSRSSDATARLSPGGASAEEGRDSGSGGSLGSPDPAEGTRGRPAPTGEAMAVASAGASPSPVPVGKVGGTLTETELMKRRRLLDVHIFE